MLEVWCWYTTMSLPIYIKSITDICIYIWWLFYNQCPEQKVLFMYVWYCYAYWMDDGQTSVHINSWRLGVMYPVCIWSLMVSNYFTYWLINRSPSLLRLTIRTRMFLFLLRSFFFVLHCHADQVDGFMYIKIFESVLCFFHIATTNPLLPEQQNTLEHFWALLSIF